MANRNMTLSRIQRIAVVAALIALPLSPVVSVESDDVSVEQLGVHNSFDEFETLPAAPVTKGNVVNLAEIKPPVEVAPKPEPKPKAESPAGRTVRSLGKGVASYYGRRFHGRLTANGERFNMNAMTAAHKTLPFGTKVRVTNTRNGRSVVVRINDRGPFVRGRHIDLSRAAGRRIGLIGSGHARVKLEVVK